MTNLDSVLKKQRYHFTDKGLHSQICVFSSSHVWMWELDHKEGWAPRNWCFWAVVLEKTLETPLDCKEIQTVNSKRNQSWISIGRTDAEALILWPADVKSWLVRKDPDAGKDWRQEKTRMTEDEMVRWHHRLSGMSLSNLWEMVKDREAWRVAVHEVGKRQTWLSGTPPSPPPWSSGVYSRDARKL